MIALLFAFTEYGAWELVKIAALIVAAAIAIGTIIYLITSK